MNIKSVNRE